MRALAVALLAAAVVVVATGCASVFPGAHRVPGTVGEWKAWVHRWGDDTRAALQAHLARTWSCDDVELEHTAVTTVVDDVGVRSPAVEWDARGCGRDERWLVTCPVDGAPISAKPGEVACSVRAKHRDAPGMPAVVPDVGGVVVVKDLGATS